MSVSLICVVHAAARQLTGIKLNDASLPQAQSFAGLHVRATSSDQFTIHLRSIHTMYRLVSAPPNTATLPDSKALVVDVVQAFCTDTPEFVDLRKI